MPAWIVALLVFLALDLLLVVWIFFRRRRGRAFSFEEATYIQSQWIRIIDSFHAHPKHAVLDADKLLDYALERQGFEGSLGEKLKLAGFRFSDLDAIWNAHKLRNKIAHELKDVDVGEAKLALQRFKKGLNDLGAKL